MTYQIHHYPAELIDVVHLDGGKRVVVRPVLPQDADLKAVFFHDVPDDVVAEAWERGEVGQSDRPFAPPPMPALPAGLPIRYLVGRDDRFFPLEFQRRTVQERLGFAPDETDGGHLLPLAQPEELVRRLEAYRIEAGL